MTYFDAVRTIEYYGNKGDQCMITVYNNLEGESRGGEKGGGERGREGVEGKHVCVCYSREKVGRENFICLF